jgi:hypothetical protein
MQTCLFLGATQIERYTCQTSESSTTTLLTVERSHRLLPLAHLVPANLQTDYKSEVWRSTGTTATLTITWATAELIGMFALAFASLSAASTFRVRGYSNAGDAVPVVDVTGNLRALAPRSTHSAGALFRWALTPTATVAVLTV